MLLQNVATALPCYPVDVAAKKKTKRAEARPDMFEGARSQLAAIDFADPIGARAAIVPILGQLIVQVATARTLTRQEMQRLRWVQTLTAQMLRVVDSAIDGEAAIAEAMRRIQAQNERGSDTVEPSGPQLEVVPQLVTDGHAHSEGNGAGTRQAHRGRPRAAALA